MIYQHKYFKLNTENKKVFDENGKELRLTGNAYRSLVFLCEKKNANITEIGDFLDWARDYEENHLRQYRYKINSIIGRDVIEYKNGIYSLLGEVKKAQKMAENDRNTDLLQSDPVKLKNVVMNKIEKIKFIRWPAIVASIFLLLSLLNWPYGYYTFLRITITGIAAYYAYYLYTTERRNFWFWSFVVIAILFNPIVPIYIGNKQVWKTIDFITAFLFLFQFLKRKKL